MITIKGKSVFGGVSIGKIMFYKRNEKVIKRTHVDDVDAEWKRFCDAKDTAVSQLKELYDKAIEPASNPLIFKNVSKSLFEVCFSINVRSGLIPVS